MQTVPLGTAIIEDATPLEHCWKCVAHWEAGARPALTAPCVSLVHAQKKPVTREQSGPRGAAGVSETVGVGDEESDLDDE